jgi:hypothetical protein
MVVLVLFSVKGESHEKVLNMCHYELGENGTGTGRKYRY